MTMIDPDDLAERLKTLDGDFKTAPAPGGGKFDRFKPPEGVYWATVDSVDFFEAKQTGAAYLKIVFLVAQNEHKGKTIEKVYVLEPHKAIPGISNEDAIAKLGYLRQDLSILGIDVEDISLADVRPGSAIWDTIMDRNVELAVRFGKKNDADGDPYRNVYINTSLEPIAKRKSDIPTDEPSPNTTTNDDGIPF